MKKFFILLLTLCLFNTNLIFGYTDINAETNTQTKITTKPETLEQSFIDNKDYDK